MRRGIAIAAGALACALILVSTAAAQERCKVMDPTGTPLNVRDTPSGQKVGELTNGDVVSIVDAARDARGKPWALVVRYSDGAPLGWVFREFIACY